MRSGLFQQPGQSYDNKPISSTSMCSSQRTVPYSVIANVLCYLHHITLNFIMCNMMWFTTALCFRNFQPVFILIKHVIFILHHVSCFGYLNLSEHSAYSENKGVYKRHRSGI
jgi:hypothetical protein